MYCIFNDHGSGYIQVVFQSHLNSSETIQVKVEFEKHCQDFRVIPQTYLMDNGTAFTSKAFQEHISSFNQVVRFAGVGGHGNNGIAERSIRTIMSISRVMMLHSGIHWPQVADTALWPMAVSYAVLLWNHVPQVDTGISPHDLFSRTRWPQHRFLHFHVWGCPVYVLDKTITGGMKLPRWKARSERCMFVLLSNNHATSVPLVLNLRTGTITPQHHVVFDDWFATVSTSEEAIPDFGSPEWSNLFGESAYQYMEDSEVPVAPVEVGNNDNFCHRIVSSAFERESSLQPLPVQPLAPHMPSHRSPSPSAPSLQREQTPVIQHGSPLIQKETVSVSVPVQPATVVEAKQNTESSPTVDETVQEEPSSNQDVRSPRTQRSPVLRRSKRTKTAIDRFVPGLLAYFANIFKASASDPDTLTWDEAMNEDPEGWSKAASKEVHDLEEKATWDEVDKSTAETPILPGTWVFRKKRSPDGTLRKLKARFCVRGDLQDKEGIETYAPVVSSSSMRFFLTLSLLLGWDTCSIDFQNAFVQSVLEHPIWIHVPRGFRSAKQNTCLKLKKSLYGLINAPRLWYDHLLTFILSEGFTQGSTDKCFFYKEDIFFILHVDDAGIAFKSQSVLQNFLSHLDSAGFKFSREGTFHEFLGITFTKCDKQGSVTLTQTGLIAKIISLTGLKDANPNRTPAQLQALGKDPEGEPFSEVWPYASIVGMLMYLATHTRPDIAFAVSQVARFTHAPKKSHGVAVKQIVRYLVGTQQQGITYVRSISLCLEAYVDADFCGLYRSDPPQDRSSARSRTAFIIFLGPCPLLWKSCLQSEVALSTVEAEYYAMSECIRVLLPLKALVREVVNNLNLPSEIAGSITCKVFEDNMGAISLANKQQFTPRNKHFHVKFHHFWDAVQKQEVHIIYIKSAENRADFLTKAVPRETYDRLRRLVQGW